MPEKPKDHRDRYLEMKGNQVSDVSSTKKGDILGIPLLRRGDENTIRLYYVNDVDLEPYILGSKSLPVAYLERPHVGLTVSQDLQANHFYLHMPMAGESCKTIWSPASNLEDLAQSNPSQVVSFQEIDLAEDKFDGNVYLVKDEFLCRLGSLIPKFVLPSFAFLIQSRNPQDLFDYVNASKEAISSAREVWANLARINLDYQKRASQSI